MKNYIINNFSKGLVLSVRVHKKLVISNNRVKLILWHSLLYLCIIYNFHRYIFKYSHGGYPKEGYQQTPLLWQMGKFLIISFILSIIYYKCGFTSKVKKSVIVFYFFIFVIFTINVISGIIYKSFSTDELEYCVYAIMLFPLSIVCKNDLELLAKGLKDALTNCQLLILFSNWIVVYNYFVNKVLPFHAYEGVLLRFGGLWDDPNTLAIISVLMFGYSMMNKQYMYAALNVINVIWAISFSGYILLFVVAFYFFIKSNIRVAVKLAVAICAIIFVITAVLYSYGLLVAVYEAKKQSVEEHTTLDMKFNVLPLMESMQFHETWYFSINANYFPFSIVMSVSILCLFIRSIINKVITLQHLLIIIFFVANAFLPFLYMFPVNFLALVLLIFYLRKVYI